MKIFKLRYVENDEVIAIISDYDLAEYYRAKFSKENNRWIASILIEEAEWNE